MGTESQASSPGEQDPSNDSNTDSDPTAIFNSPRGCGCAAGVGIAVIPLLLLSVNGSSASGFVIVSMLPALVLIGMLIGIGALFVGRDSQPDAPQPDKESDHDRAAKWSQVNYDKKKNKGKGK